MALGAQAGVHSRGRSFCLERKVASWAERVEARLEKRLRAFGFEKAQEPSTKTHGAVARLNGGGTGSVHHNHFYQSASIPSGRVVWTKLVPTQFQNVRLGTLSPLCATVSCEIPRSVSATPAMNRSPLLSFKRHNGLTKSRQTPCIVHVV